MIHPTRIGNKDRNTNAPGTGRECSPTVGIQGATHLCILKILVNQEITEWENVYGMHFSDELVRFIFR